MERQIQVIVKQSALNDLESAYQYYREHYSLVYAEKFRLDFFEQVRAISPNPLMHPECRFLPTKNQTYRNIIWGNYLIVFKVKKASIEVLLLFHTKQHPKRLKVAKRVK